MWPLVVIVALFWLGGSAAMAALMPWRTLDVADRGLMLVVVLGWPPVLAWALFDLLWERWRPRRAPWWMRDPDDA